jgi:alpha-tubulin suppressor-like RCC1 family protein
LTVDGKVNAFGWNEDGQLGVENPQSHEVRLPGKAIKVSAGALFSACLLETGEIFVWGSGEQGQLGLGNSTTFTKKPSKIVSLNNIVDLICGENSILTLTTKGQIFGWGQGLVSNFTDSKNFPSGSDIICFLPHQLSEVDIIHKVLMKKMKFR